MFKTILLYILGTIVLLAFLTMLGLLLYWAWTTFSWPLATFITCIVVIFVGSAVGNVVAED